MKALLYKVIKLLVDIMFMLPKFMVKGFKGLAEDRYELYKILVDLQNKDESNRDKELNRFMKASEMLNVFEKIDYTLIGWQTNLHSKSYELLVRGR